MRKYGYVPHVRSRGEEKKHLAAEKVDCGDGAFVVQQVQENLGSL